MPWNPESFDKKYLSNSDLKLLKYFTDYIDTNNVSFNNFDAKTSSNKNLCLGSFLYKIANNFVGDKAYHMRELGKYYERINNEKRAYHWFYISSRRGDHIAMYKMGIYHEHGYGETSLDLNLAAEWYKKAADKNHHISQYKVGQFYEEGIGFEKDSVESLKYYLKAESYLTDLNLSIKIAKMFESGEGTAADFEKAFERYYYLAENFEDPFSLFKVGTYYYSGNFVEENIDNAIIYFTRSANKNNPLACIKLATIYEKGYGRPINYEEAFNWYQKAADIGSAYAKYELGLLYQYGIGVDQDLEKAFGLFLESAAKKGYPGDNVRWGCYQLGTLYEKGVKQDDKIIVPRDLEKAIHYYRISGMANNGMALIRLGELSYNGVNIDGKTTEDYFKMVEENGKSYYIRHLFVTYMEGIYMPKDPEKAIYYLKKQSLDKNNIHLLGMAYEEIENFDEAYNIYLQVIEQGNARGYVRIGQLYENGRKFQQDYEKAAEYYQKGLEEGFLFAKYYLANMYENGMYFERNMQKAFEMYMELAHNYEERACFKIGQFYENGEVVEKDLKKAGLWYWRATRRTSKEISDKFNSFFN